MRDPRDPIRVALLIDHMGAGGAQVLVRDLALRLDRRRFLPHVCALRDSDHATGLQESDVPHISLGRRGLTPDKLKRLESWLREHRINLIHAHLDLARVAAALVAHRLDIPFIWHEHTGMRPLPVPFGALGRRLLNRIDRHLAKRMHALVTVSEALAEESARLRRLPRRKIHTIHGWIPQGVVRPRDGPPPVSGLPRGGILCGAVGRLHAEKGYEVLLEAWQEVVRQVPEAHLVLVGEGPERGALEARVRQFGIEQRVTFAGHCRDVAAILPHFRLLAMPSRRECFPVTLLEAMAAGVPVVASRVGGIPELVGRDEEAALLVPVGDPHALAQAINRVLESTALQQQLSQAARKRVERFDGRQAIADIELLYRGAVGDFPSGGP